jgi:uncharacterized membrane protein YkoI
MAMSPHPLLVLALVLSAICLPGSASADSGRRDQDLARQARERGEIEPLARILSIVRARLPGDVVGIEIERRHGRWFYELRVADKAGRLFEVHVDARSGAIERIKEK